MRLFCRCALASLLLISFSISFASETSTWGGPYVGAYLGAGLGSDQISTQTGPLPSNPFLSATEINEVNNSGTFDSNPAAIIGGVQAGQDWVWKKLVYGVMLDYGALPLSASKSVNNVTYSDSSYQYSMTTSMRANWLFRLRGRLGYELPISKPTLWYVTGGMAMTQLKISHSFSDNSPSEGVGSGDSSNNEVGWTLGTGLEFALHENVYANLEYSYVNFPSIKTADRISNAQGGFGSPPGSQSNPFMSTGQFHANLFTMGLKYRF